jgi:hypothetical protein
MKHVIQLHYSQNLNSYVTQNEVRLHCKEHPFNIIYRSNGCVQYHKKTQKYTGWAKCRDLFYVNTGGRIN